MVSVVVDDEILRRRVAAALRGDAIEVGGESRADAIVLARDGAWRSTLERAAAARARHRAPVVVVAATFELRELPRLVEAGVAGVVLEHDAESTVASAVRAVVAGQLVFPARGVALARKPVLSTREKQVLGMVVLGCTNGEIAAKLHVAETTVKSHLTSSFRKLGVRSRNEASARILDPRNGLGPGVLTIAEPDATLDFLELETPA